MLEVRLLKKVFLLPTLLRQALLRPRFESGDVNLLPTAEFSHIVTNLSVAFTDTSTDADGTIVSWLWDFGDGATSTLQNPTRAYATEGNKTVTLTVTDNNGGTSQVEHTVAPVPAAPTFFAIGTLTANAGGHGNAWPAGHQADDIGIVFEETQAGQASVLNATNGFTEVPTVSPQDAGGTTTRLTAFWCRATSGTMATPTVLDSGNHNMGVMIVIRGCIATGNPWDVLAGDTAVAATTAVSIPGATTTGANRFIVAAASTDFDSLLEQFSGWTNASLASITERHDASSDVGSGGGIGIATGVKVATGAVSATTATLANAACQGRIMLALKGVGAV